MSGAEKLQRLDFPAQMVISLFQRQRNELCLIFPNEEGIEMVGTLEDSDYSVLELRI